MPFIFIVQEGLGADVKRANLTSQIDNVTTIFTVPESYETGSLGVYYNGIQQVKDVSYSETSTTTFTLNFTPQDGDYLTVEYNRNS